MSFNSKKNIDVDVLEKLNNESEIENNNIINYSCPVYSNFIISGYGQEDSMLQNKNAIEKGRFRAQSLKKYLEQTKGIQPLKN